MKQTLTLGFSPCPNDTFIFDALVHGRIDTGDLNFEVVMEDVEALNKMAAANRLDITKLSYHAFAHLTDSYQLLRSGSALGHGCGPLLISRQPMSEADINRAKIAIPGEMTTANFLLSVAFPKAQHKEAVLFSDIEEKVLDGTFDAGLIIHENRFTYEQKGLHKIIDLGQYWENLTWLPIPLGGIVIKRSLPEAIKRQVSDMIAESVRYAFAHKEASMPYTRAHAQEMEDHVMQQHIDLYVNEYSVDLGEKGETAVLRLMQSAKEKGLIKSYREPLWVESSI
jgi:1,4-dihydroxy-6-naphthoate synthase